MNIEGMTTKLSQLLSTAAKEKKLSVDAMAKAIGVSTISLKGILKGKSSPNLRTLGKYAAYLGVQENELAPQKTTKAVKGSKKPGKKSAKSGKAGKSAKAKSKVTPGAPGKASGAKSRRKAGNKAASASTLLMEAAKEAGALLSDTLAMQVHKATADTRKMIDLLLNRR